MDVNGIPYETVIGLEIHAELLTRSKVFCGCSTEFGGEPNTRVCPVCLGLPGSLPVLNEQAVEFAMRAGLALNCRINELSRFDRKNYFYPDLPKAYQISQYELPLCVDGHVEFEVDGTRERVGILRVHLEEDTGKSLHSTANIAGSQGTLLDYNRCGVPLIEIVTRPDLRSPEAARRFLEELRSILEYTGVSDVKMEEGSLRCDANISIRPVGSGRLGTKTEVKNMNSFRAVQRALEYEARRQAALLADGELVVQETRGWDEASGRTVPMRSKEQVHDYRYFPEPDLVPLRIDPAWVERVRASLPELPAARRERLAQQYGIPAYDATVLTANRELGQFFEEAAAAYGSDAKVVSNWVMGELARLVKESGKPLAQAPVRAVHLVELLGLLDSGVIGGPVAKEVFEEVFRTGARPAEVVKARGLEQISDEGALVALVDQVIEGNPAAVASFRAGKEQALGFLVGQVMKLTRGRANPKRVNELVRERLASP